MPHRHRVSAATGVRRRGRTAAKTPASPDLAYGWPSAAFSGALESWRWAASDGGSSEAGDADIDSEAMVEDSVG